MNAQEVGRLIVQSAKKHLPKSRVRADFSGGVAPSIHVRFALWDKSANGIVQNDPAWHQFVVFGFDKEGINAFDSKHEASFHQRSKLRWEHF